MAAATFMLHRPLQASSGVTHSVACSLTAAGAAELCVIRHSHMEVFTLADKAADTLDAQADSNNGLSDLEHATSEQALLLRRFDKQLFGDVEGIWSEPQQTRG